ncbi:MAG: nitrile hydratase subunit beta [Myxococcota bacterium]
MNGIHDLGGMHGFGPVVVEPNEPVFHGAWEGRVLALVSLALARRIANVDAFRHAIERLEPVEYLSAGYYGRWLGALELIVHEWRGRGETLDAGGPGTLRMVTETARFAPGEAVRTRNLQPTGHTRLPGYARGKRGTIARVHAGFVFPDTNAAGRGERPQWVYAVRFDATELFGTGAEPNACVHVDLFESYLEPEPGDV